MGYMPKEFRDDPEVRRACAWCRGPIYIDERDASLCINCLTTSFNINQAHARTHVGFNIPRMCRDHSLKNDMIVDDMTFGG